MPRGLITYTSPFLEALKTQFYKFGTKLQSPAQRAKNSPLCLWNTFHSWQRLPGEVITSGRDVERGYLRLSRAIEREVECHRSDKEVHSWHWKARASLVLTISFETPAYQLVRKGVVWTTIAPAWPTTFHEPMQFLARRARKKGLISFFRNLTPPKGALPVWHDLCRSDHSPLLA